jgi:hypothetical protein
MAGPRQESGPMVSTTTTSAVRARPCAARPTKSGAHGRIADGSGPESSLAVRMRWSGAGDSTRRDGL